VGEIPNFIFLARFEPNHWTLRVQDLRVTLVQEACLEVPLAAFHVGAENQDSVLWRRRILSLDNLEVKDKIVDGDLCLSRIVLERTSHEALCEVEERDVVVARNSILFPVIKELDSLNQVFYVASEGFE